MLCGVLVKPFPNSPLKRATSSFAKRSSRNLIAPLISDLRNRRATAFQSLISIAKSQRPNDPAQQRRRGAPYAQSVSWHPGELSIAAKHPSDTEADRAWRI